MAKRGLTLRFRIKDNISGYASTDMLLRDPQGGTHFLSALRCGFLGHLFFTGSEGI